MTLLRHALQSPILPMTLPWVCPVTNLIQILQEALVHVPYLSAQPTLSVEKAVPKQPARAFVNMVHCCHVRWLDAQVKAARVEWNGCATERNLHHLRAAPAPPPFHPHDTGDLAWNYFVLAPQLHLGAGDGRGRLHKRLAFAQIGTPHHSTAVGGSCQATLAPSPHPRHAHAGMMNAMPRLS